MPQNKASDITTVIDITDKMLGGKAERKKPFRMAAKDGVGEIFIFDDIGEGFFSDGITPKSFAADLKALGAVRTLNIFINSPGGAVFDGVAIFNQLKRHPARKNVFIDGIAASIASVIAMAGDEINIAANGFIMIHEPFTVAFGTAADLRKTADQLDKINDSILNTYAVRTGAPENIIGDMMAAETWMNAEEAVELGFADKITEEVAIAAHFDLSQFHNVPASASEALDLVKNPPKVNVGASIQLQPTFRRSGDKVFVLNEWPARTLIVADLLKDTGNSGVGISYHDSVLTLTVANGSATYVKEGEDAHGSWDCRLTESTYEHQPWPPDDDPGDQPRPPSLAVTKMRQRMQKRGIARKGDDESQPVA